MLINQTNNNDGQVPKLAKNFKDVHFNPNTNMWIHHEDEATYVCVSFHPYYSILIMRMKRHMYMYHSIPIIPSLSCL